MISKAIAFANEKHAGQVRKGSRIPYILHPLEAGIIISQIVFDEELIAAAILHDLVEDAGVTLDTIAQAFSPRVAQLVASQTEDKSRTWNERKQHTVEKLPDAAYSDKGREGFQHRSERLWFRRELGRRGCQVHRPVRCPSI